MTRWFVADLRGVEQTTEADIRARLAACSLTPQALVWRGGLAEWEPLQAHFGPDALPATDVPAPESLPPPLPFATLPPALRRALRRDDELPPRRQQILRALTAAAAWIACSILLRHIHLLDPATAVFAYAGAPIACCWLTFRWARGLSRRADAHFATGAAGRAALDKLLAFGGCVSALAVSLPMLAATNDIYLFSERYRQMARYTVRMDPAAKALRVIGPIGPGMSSRVAELLAENPDTRFLLITSDGGLREEAQNIRAVIDRHPQLVVVARKQCDSACVRILLSGKRRIAEWNMQIGFHDARAVFGLLDRLSPGWLDADNRREEEWLRSRGVSEDVLAAARGKTGEAIHYVSAIKLAEDGALTGLVAGRQSVSVDEALALLRDEAVGKDPASQPLIDALFDLRKRVPDVFGRHADNFYRALLEGEGPGIRAASVRVARGIAAAALSAADDGTVYRYLRLRIATLRQLAVEDKSGLCRDDPVGALSGWSARMAPAVTTAQLMVMTPALDSAAAAAWTVRPLADRIAVEGRQMHATVIAARGGGAGDHCAATLDLFTAYAARGEAEGAALFRWALNHAMPAH